jgi:hypothetical protein
MSVRLRQKDSEDVSRRLWIVCTASYVRGVGRAEVGNVSQRVWVSVPSVRAFPVVYTRDVPALIAFYVRLGFAVTFRFPPDDDQGYASLARDGSDLVSDPEGNPVVLAQVQQA